MRILTTALPGLVELRPEVHGDARGLLVKDFERDVYAAAGLPVTFAEEMHSSSAAGVLRGMHFQTPPFAQGKTVFCEQGAIFDVVVDIRVGSPTYARAASFELRAAQGNGLYIPEGFAHGFLVLEEPAVVAYRLTAPWSREHEAGIRWDSIGVDWPIERPLTNERDAAFPALAEYASPFRYEDGRA